MFFFLVQAYCGISIVIGVFFVSRPGLWSLVSWPGLVWSGLVSRPGLGPWSLVSASGRWSLVSGRGLVSGLLVWSGLVWFLGMVSWPGIGVLLCGVSGISLLWYFHCDWCFSYVAAWSLVSWPGLVWSGLLAWSGLVWSLGLVWSGILAWSRSLVSGLGLWSRPGLWSLGLVWLALGMVSTLLLRWRYHYRCHGVGVWG